jgi:hypothetical protein
MGRKSRLNWGGIIQAGWMLNNRIELFGRYDFTHMSSAFVLGNEDNFHEFTIGANYYLGADGSLGHHAKITVDAGYLPHGSPTLAPNVGTGSIIGGNESKQVYLRGQLQIAI